MPCFPTFVFPFQSSKSDVLRLMALIITFSYLTFLQSKTVSAFYERSLCLYFTAKIRI